MKEKDIKRQIRKQLKLKHPNWKSLAKKEKKRIAKEISDGVIAVYQDNYETVPIEELIGLEDQSLENIMSVKEMADFVTTFNQKSPVLPLSIPKKVYSENLNKELIFIDQLLDNKIIDYLLSDASFTPEMRIYFPHHFFRAELLKALKYPEISYRKFCTEEYIGPDRIENRCFMGFPANAKEMIHHTQLSTFRRLLSFSQLTNLLVYILYYGYECGLLSGCTLHGIDSTEIANDNKIPLYSIEVDGKKIKIYQDIDCDVGVRRNKRDKAKYVVGYRLHMLTAVNPTTGHSYPLASLLAPANHHDSLFLRPLIDLAQAMGIEMQLITADEAYHDKDGSILSETGVHVITPASSMAKIPANIDPKTFDVYCHDSCEIPMIRVGNTENEVEYSCGATLGECFQNECCDQCRNIPHDRGHFQRIPVDSEQGQKAIDIRKNIERPFNLLKKREGLENARVRSQSALVARSTFATIATLLIEMAGTRKKPKKPEYDQLELILEAA